MIRGCLSILAWGVLLVVLGIPLLVLGFVYPSRRAGAWVSTVMSRSVLAICGVRLTIEGLERAADGRSKFFMGNHQSALDIPILITALSGDVRFMAKKSLFRYPIFGWLLRQYGYIPIDRANPRSAMKSLDRMIERVRQKPISLAVFPEGTRTSDGTLLPFRKGAMKICRRSGLPAMPFCIDGSYRVNPRGRLRAYPGPVRLTFGKETPADVVAAMSPTELHQSVREAVADMLGAGGGQASDAAPMSGSKGTRDDGQRGIPAAAHF